MDPARDMGAVADLIEAAFAGDMDQAGCSMLRDMRNMARLGGLLWWFDGPGTGVNQMLSGFVWVEDGQVVGNVTVTPTPHTPDRWIISNVAVAKTYRRRGIARRLTSAAVDMIRKWHGKAVTLQVRDDNPTALHIYQTLGFHVLFGTAHMRLEPVTPVNPLPPRDTRLRRLSDADAEKAYEMACAATPQAAQTEQPVRLAHYQFGWERRLSDWFRTLTGKAPALRLVVERGAQLQATVITQPTGRGSESSIELTVHPNARGQLEKELISYALYHLSHWSQHSVIARHPTYHVEGVEALTDFGFQTERTLLWMKCEL